MGAPTAAVVAPEAAGAAASVSLATAAAVSALAALSPPAHAPRTKTLARSVCPRNRISLGLQVRTNNSGCSGTSSAPTSAENVKLFTCEGKSKEKGNRKQGTGNRYRLVGGEPSP